jgi:hypothetical protein
MSAGRGGRGVRGMAGQCLLPADCASTKTKTRVIEVAAQKV